MRVFKFGGASVQDAESIINLSRILQDVNSEKIVVVVSAMGKTTRELEEIARSYFRNVSFSEKLEDVLKKHRGILEGLFENDKAEIYFDFEKLVKELIARLQMKPSMNFDYEYDQIVSFGELFSSKIISAYLNKDDEPCKWIDIRRSIKTDSIYRNASVNWSLSSRLINENFVFTDHKILLTQGFIASNEKNITTTLGIEGSDFSAAILTYALKAKEMVVWKDVAGFFNSDPKLFTKLTKLDAVSFHEAVELSYFGAKIIHPKTIKPLQNKNIPLIVKSFKHPDEVGTKISASTENKCGLDPEVPIYIIKNDQVLISIAPKDFSFIAEDNLSSIFASIAKQRIKVNLMQNSAISFSICVDNQKERLTNLIDELSKNYKVLFNDKLSLITIRHYNKKIIDKMLLNRVVFVQQKSRHTVRYVVK